MTYALIEMAAKHGITPEEFERICELLDRPPNEVEIGMFSVMWSEHCSYKNSLAELKKLPRSGGKLLVSAGEENAGLVDIGEGLAVAFKIESHNHPSAVEPYQGAATGVGGILRDVFTMGARPIAALNSLRFGDPNHPRTSYLAKGIVKGIGDYGNSFGVPTVGGDVYFDASYNENPLVNAMAVGVVKHGEIAKASARTPGNIVIIVGSSTGRDGIHGASFASETISEDSEQKRPSVQVGDPFTEKLLLEATLEAVRAGLVEGVQDMGAAGITCSSSEMSARGNVGMDIDLDLVPTREENMTAYEILLSESQERMLIVAKPEHQPALEQIFSKWDLHCKAIGVVTHDGVLRIRKDGMLQAELPARSLVLGGDAPVYFRESRRPAYLDKLLEFDPASLPYPKDYAGVLIAILGSPNVCSRKWVYEQYDTMVRTNSIMPTLSDGAIVRIKGTTKALALKTDCNPRYVYANPYLGGMIAVAESARNVACVGATPLAITNCLNFGDPYDPEVYWQFQEAVRGIGDACRVLGTPVTGGNVSFYNEGLLSAVLPTPVIGMLGLLEDHALSCSPSFKSEGDIIILLGQTNGHLGASEYLARIHQKHVGDAPNIDLFFEQRLQASLLDLISNRILTSCHDLSEGGLAVALSESCIASQRKLGARITRCPDGIRPDAWLFGEDQSRALVSCAPASLADLCDMLSTHEMPYSVIGHVCNDQLEVEGLLSVRVGELAETYEAAFPV